MPPSLCLFLYELVVRCWMSQHSLVRASAHLLGEEWMTLHLFFCSVCGFAIEPLTLRKRQNHPLIYYNTPNLFILFIWFGLHRCFIWKKVILTATLSNSF